MAILNFSDVLMKVGLDPKNVKLIRHALSDERFRECYEAGMAYEYTQHQKKNSAKVIPTGSRLSAMAVHMRDYIPAIASMALCLMRRMYARLDCLRVRQKSIVARWHFMIWNMWTC